MLKQLVTTTAIAVALSAPLTAGPGSAQTGSTKVAPAETTRNVEKMQPDQIRVSKFIGRDVYGADGKKIGDVSELVAEPDGKISEVVLSVGGFLGIGDKHVAVKMADLKHDANGRLTVHLTKDQLSQAPAYEYADRDSMRTGTSGSSASPRGATPPLGAGSSTPPASRNTQ
jgi:sporulation protein YlmC with PRC-barrel domain